MPSAGEGEEVEGDFGRLGMSLLLVCSGFSPHGISRMGRSVAHPACFGAAQSHFRVIAISPGMPPGKLMISTLSLYPRGRKYFAQS
jgi:hypothetical protein